MTQTTAILPPTASQPLLPRVPTVYVLLDERPSFGWRVTQYERIGDLGEQRLTLTASPRVLNASSRDIEQHGHRLRTARRIQIGMPYATHRPDMLTLFEGQPHATTFKRDAVQRIETVMLIDRWTHQLDQPVENEVRDALRHGQELDWIVQQWAAVTQMPIDLADSSDTEPIQLMQAESQTWRDVLQAVCDKYGLHFYRQPGTSLQQSPSARLMSDDHARPIRLPRTGDAWTQLKQIHETDEQGPTLWIAQAAAQQVESTFTLISAWPGDLQDQPDTQYARSTLEDFASVAHVFRRFVLNEDGAFAGTRFDAAALLEEPLSANQLPLRFHPCLTQDASGRSLGYVIDYSLDSGANWQRYTDAFAMLHDRAGLVIDADVLPSGWIAAARSDTLRLRITATLISPNAQTAERWLGHAFFGKHHVRPIDLRDRFAYRRVAESSQFAEAVTDGSLQAQTQDDRQQLRNWLEQHVRNQDRDAQYTLHLQHWPLALQPGDRLPVPPHAHDGTPARPWVEPTEQLRLRRITFDFDRGQSQLLFQPRKRTVDHV